MRESWWTVIAWKLDAKDIGKPLVAFRFVKGLELDSVAVGQRHANPKLAVQMG